MTNPPNRDSDPSGDPLRDQIHDLLDNRMSDADAERLRARIATDPELRREYTELSRLIGDLASLRDERAPRPMQGAVLEALRSTPSSGGSSRRLFLLVAPLAAAIVLSALFFVFDRGRFGAGESEHLSASSKVAMERDRALDDGPRSAESAEKRDAAEESKETAAGSVSDPKADAANRRDEGAVGGGGGPAVKTAEKPAIGKPSATTGNDAKPGMKSGAKPPAEAKYKAPVAPAGIEKAKSGAAGEDAESRKTPAAVPGAAITLEPPRLWRIHKRVLVDSADANKTRASRDEVSASTLGSPVTNEADAKRAIEALSPLARAAVEDARKRSPSSVHVVEITAAESEELIAHATEARFEVEEFVEIDAARGLSSPGGKNAPRKEEITKAESDSSNSAWRSIVAGKDRDAGGLAASGPQSTGGGPPLQESVKKQSAGEPASGGKDDEGRGSKSKSAAKRSEKPSGSSKSKSPEKSPARAPGSAWKGDMRRVIVVIDER